MEWPAVSTGRSNIPVQSSQALFPCEDQIRYAAFQRQPSSHLLPASHLPLSLVPGRSVTAWLIGRGAMTDKLRLLVRMDVDGAQVRIAARGRVTSQSLHALYLVVKRANTPGLMQSPG